MFADHRIFCLAQSRSYATNHAAKALRNQRKPAEKSNFIAQNSMAAMAA
jgi:hypothetical protein